MHCSHFCQSVMILRHKPLQHRLRDIRLLFPAFLSVVALACIELVYLTEIWKHFCHLANSAHQQLAASISKLQTQLRRSVSPTASPESGYAPTHETCDPRSPILGGTVTNMTGDNRLCGDHFHFCFCFHFPFPPFTFARL